MAAFLISSQNDPAVLPKLVFAAPGALFPLMALFIWLDVYRYKVYIPLFTAGKCIGIFSMLGWFIISRRFTMEGEFSWILLSGDLFALAAVLMINKDAHKSLKAENSEVN